MNRSPSDAPPAPPLDGSSVRPGADTCKAIELREQGLYDQEIANLMGLRREHVARIFEKARRHGIQVPRSPYQDRCADRFHKEDRGWQTECWIWNHSTDEQGYGRWYWGLAHRVQYENTHGQLPDNLVLHHLCEQPACINPDHLQPMTRAEHVWIHRGRRE